MVKLTIWLFKVDLLLLLLLLFLFLIGVIAGAFINAITKIKKQKQKEEAMAKLDKQIDTLLDIIKKEKEKQQ